MSEKTFTIKFTAAEAQALLTLLHLAVKSAGLEGPHAANAVHFQQKINKAFEDSNKPAQILQPTLEEMAAAFPTEGQ